MFSDFPGHCGPATRLETAAYHQIERNGQGQSVPIGRTDSARVARRRRPATLYAFKNWRRARMRSMSGRMPKSRAMTSPSSSNAAARSPSPRPLRWRSRSA